MADAAIGLGSNLGNPAANVRAAIAALSQIGDVVAQSRLYRSKPWGPVEQPDYCNAVAIVRTPLAPLDLLRALKELETRLGRRPSVRWGPREIDLDILLYGDRQVDEPELTVPHPSMAARAFVLAPLAELMPEYERILVGLDANERESVALMSEEPLIDHVRTLAQAFLETDLMRLRIEDDEENAVELRRKAVAAPRPAAQAAAEAPPEQPPDVDAIRADLVGIVQLSRPAVKVGDRLERDRELAFVEALGIRTPVRSLGAGTVTAILCKDGDAVDYGKKLFEIARV